MCRARCGEMSRAMEGMGWSWAADVWVAVSLGAAPILLACIFLYSQALCSAASRKGAEVRGRFWQLPLAGESIQLLTAPSPEAFLLPRIKRYGPVFRTHLLGKPTVCVTEPETIKFVTQSPKLFKGAYDRRPPSDMFGKHGIFQMEGEAHSLYRRLVLAPLTPEALRRFTPRIDRTAQGCLQSMVPLEWDPSSSVVIKLFDEAKRFSFDVALQFICDSLTDRAVVEKLRESVSVLEKGVTTALPLSIPGTPYKRAMEARQQIVSLLNDVIEGRRAATSSAHHEDLIASFLKLEDLKNHQITDNIIFVMFAGYDTTATSLCWVLNNLCLHPDIFQAVKAENDAVAGRRTCKDDPITWDDLQQLPVTRRVLDESLRLANVAPFALREAIQDVVYKGIFFPKGWTVITWFRSVHLDSKLFPDPYRFDPDRFKTAPKTNTYTPFGNGYRVCPGSELGKLDILVFLHRFIQSYEFEPTIELALVPKKVDWLLPKPAEGLPLRIRRRRS